MKNNYKIGLASRTYNTDGAMIINPLPQDTNVRDQMRRVSRTKTLDGGVVITDGGVSAGDRTFDIALASDNTKWGILQALFNNALWVTVSTDEACFLAKINNIAEADGKIRINILIKEKLTA